MKTECNVKISSEIYSQKVLWMAADILSNEFFIKIEKEDKYYLVQLKSKYDSLLKETELIDLFIDHLNNQQIRSKIQKETGKIREMIVSLALYSIDPFEDESKTFDINGYPDEANYLLDLKGIGETFEEYERTKAK
jgi:His-Xaa-Ser system protein HxsD